MSRPRVSVILPTRNRLERLRRALASIDRQTFRDFDLWIVDDGSTDGSAHYLRDGGARTECSNVPALHVLHNESPMGAAAARNRAIAASRGELLAFLDDDDEWLPDYLAQQVAHLDRHPTAGASWASHVEVTQGGTVTHPDLRPLFDYPSELLHLLTESHIHTLSIVACRREAFDRIGLLDESLAVVHDLDWYARLLMGHGEITALPGPPLVRHETPGGLVARYRQWHEEESRVLHRVLAQSGESPHRAAQVRAHRALFFARVGLAHRDYSFAARRLLDAARYGLLRSVRIAARRVSRNLRSPAPPDANHHTMHPGRTP